MAISSALIAYLADEAAFAYAAKDILVTVGGFDAAAVRFAATSSATALPDNCLLIRFTRGPATPEDRLRRPDNSLQEYSTFTGVLEISSRLLAVDNLDSEITGCISTLDEHRARIRACFLRSARTFTVGRLANYEIEDVVPGQTESGVDNAEESERDVIVERFTIRYARIAANWPA